MSLIHEALKKVERQRQLGSAPTLDSPRYQRRRRRWPWALLLLLILVVAGAWIWRAPLVHKARTVVSLLTGSGVPGSSGKTAAPTAAAAQAPAPAKADQPSAVAPVRPDATGTAKQTVASAKPAARPAPKPADQPGSAAGQAKSPPPNADAWLAQPEPAPAPPPESGKTATAAPPTPAAAPATAGQMKKDDPPMYWELPYAQRRDIPELSITMHMYTENPADRFVIINGVRQVEGDTLPSGLKLIAINPDGITLDKDGQDFRVPRQGSH